MLSSDCKWKTCWVKRLITQITANRHFIQKLNRKYRKNSEGHHSFPPGMWRNLLLYHEESTIVKIAWKVCRREIKYLKRRVVNISHFVIVKLENLFSKIKRKDLNIVSCNVFISKFLSLHYDEFDLRRLYCSERIRI